MQNENTERPKYKIVDRKFRFVNDRFLPDELEIRYDKSNRIALFIATIGCIAILFLLFKNPKEYYLILLLFLFGWHFCGLCIQIKLDKPQIILSDLGMKLQNGVLLEWGNISDIKFRRGVKEKGAPFLNFCYHDKDLQKYTKYDINVGSLEICHEDIEKAIAIYQDRHKLLTHTTQTTP